MGARAFSAAVPADRRRREAGLEDVNAEAKTLQLDDLLVFHNALCLGIAAGQISPTQASKSYADYKNLVTSLGGTVLPPC